MHGAEQREPETAYPTPLEVPHTSTTRYISFRCTCTAPEWASVHRSRGDLDSMLEGARTAVAKLGLEPVVLEHLPTAYKTRPQTIPGSRWR